MTTWDFRFTADGRHVEILLLVNGVIEETELCAWPIKPCQTKKIKEEMETRLLAKRRKDESG